MLVHYIICWEFRKFFKKFSSISQTPFLYYEIGNSYIILFMIYNNIYNCILYGPTSWSSTHHINVSTVLVHFICMLKNIRKFIQVLSNISLSPSLLQMLVVFKSAPILKRALKVKQAMMQLYVLKLLKMQTKYLGRQWRKSNMKTMSAIYQKVRHRLNDDWAYGNGMYSGFLLSITFCHGCLSCY